MGTEENAVAKALERCATGLKYLGVGDAGTTMGAIEFLSTEVRNGSERLADALREVAAAIDRLAGAAADRGRNP